MVKTRHTSFGGRADTAPDSPVAPVKPADRKREQTRERVKRYRARNAPVTDGNVTVTPGNGKCNANVTLPQARDVTQGVTPSVTPTDRMLQARLTDAEARITDLESRLTVLEARQPAYAPEPRIIAAPYRPVRGSGYQEQSYEDRNRMAGQMVRHTQTGKMVRVPMLDADGQPIPD